MGTADAPDGPATPTDSETPDDAETWRCKDCGKRQRDPDPPCENCWGTTFVAGDAATDDFTNDTSLASPDATTPTNVTSPRVVRVRTATTRATAVSVAVACCFAGAYTVVGAGSQLRAVMFTGALSVGVLALVFFVATVLLAVSDRVGELVAE
ncbi:hypothetical protein [Halobacterium litoreum]|uniref:RanBP2-type domain-containing protein n=1 Tax=Halobacterium litoreum TaxID=2039234 RepID=A0ABD5NIA6_9EURY|nr:hypothetical protein [Halobacterium litoreum]UHH12347.1 hypothetical protein LT972_09270 [Halobacterium litoreum]